ncbi:hypothetical protein [Streptococcus suis]|nr:hypothetical protein [Streptococcus suis]
MVYTPNLTFTIDANKSSPYFQPLTVSQTVGAVRGREDELFLD